MTYLGDFPADQAVYIHFTTHDAAGEPIAPSSAFVAADFRIYRDGSAVERVGTAGVTVVSPFDATAGRHLVTIDTSNNTDAGFFAAGHDYRVELNTAKTVDGVSQSGVAIATFSLQNRYVPAVGGGGLDAAGVRAALGLAAANLDTQIAGIPAAVESAIIDDGDATALLQAIADKIAAENPSLGDLTLAAIASAVWANGTRTLTGSVALTSSERTTLAGVIATLLATNHGSGSWEPAALEVGPDDVESIAAAVAAKFSVSHMLVSDLGRFINASEINLRQGDDYLATKGTAWEKEIAIAGYDFTAGGLNVRFGAGNTPGDPLITGTATLHSTAVGSATLRLEFDREDTREIAQGSYHWDAEVVDSDGDVLTVDGGMLNLQASWTTLA